MKFIYALIIVLFYHPLYAQQTDSTNNKSLDEVIIKAFEQNRKLKDVPAAINFLGRPVLNRFNSASIVQAVNTTPGIRMEERSPGSYRINIRGSSLRSPFGVRNVKIYFNEIPYTDPGGTSFLNQLGYYDFNSIEIIKGPGSSLYGAGTGGVMLIESMDPYDKPGAAVEFTAGSYQLKNIHAKITTGSEKYVSRVGFQHQQSEGFRKQSELKRKSISWTGLFPFENKAVLKTSFLYGDLFYETPGALNLNEFNNDPGAARPGGGGFPGAEAAKAAISQKTFLAGATFDQPLFSWLKNKTSLYGMSTELKNPNLRGYEKSTLPHFGGRTVFEFEKAINSTVMNFHLGAEIQQGMSSVNVYKNLSGNPDSLRTSDEINTRQSFLFVQGSIDIKDDWTLIAAASWNWSKLNFSRFTPATLGQQNRKFDNGLAPRLAIMKRIQQTSLYAAVSKGFSPPATSELLPTGGAINLELEAENGINYELGFKGRLSNDLTFDINAFLFRLSNTIVQRRDAGGGDFFINAGKTNQKGIELATTYPLFQKLLNAYRSIAWISYTYHHFNYKEFKPLTSDFSGNRIPGVSPHTVSAGYDIVLNKGFFGNINYYFADRLPLNDANSVYANNYHLLGAKIGYQINMDRGWKIRLNAGVENLLDQKYSLGNDINGFGGRYYNAAPGRNYFAGILIEWNREKFIE